MSDRNYLPAISIYLLISLFFSNAAQAEEASDDWFQIEYILFEHLHSDRHVLRFEDVKYKQPEQTQYQYLYPYGKALSPFQIQPISPDQSDLYEAYERLLKSPEVKVYALGMWQQVIAKESSALPLKIKAGRSFGPERFELEGSLTIKRSRYMHADVHLYLSEFDELPYETLLDWFAESDETRLPTDWLFRPVAFNHALYESKGTSWIPKNTIQFEQSRRVRDAEVHYLDHPALGMIVTIKKIEDPHATSFNFEEPTE